MHANSYGLCRSFAAGLLVHTSGPLAIADVGSRDVNGTYRALFNRHGWRYLGFDIEDGPNVDVVLHGVDDWKLGPEVWEAFDVVISGQTMEHVAAPWKWIRQVRDLMKPGGLLWLCVPNTEVYHEYPIDAWRCWPAGMSAILAEGGLQELLCVAEGPDTIGIGRKPAIEFGNCERCGMPLQNDNCDGLPPEHYKGSGYGWCPKCNLSHKWGKIIPPGQQE